MPVDVDPTVLDAARAGAGWAFERLYRQFGGPVHGYLRSQGIDDPEGATDDVFLRVFRGLDRFEGTPAGFRSWVFTIAHHLVVDRRRFASRRPAEIAVERLPDVAAPNGPEASVVAGLGLARLRALLDLLTPEQRDVLLLRFVADLSLEEVAEAQGRTVGAIKALQHRALASVRRLLEELGEISDEAVSLDAATTLAGM